MSKYGAIKTDCAAGHTHDSRLEAGRCDALHTMQDNGEITHLEQQPAFDIAFADRPVCKVILDYRYRMADSGLCITEDVKGMDNPVSRLKRKLVEAAHPGTVVTIWPIKKRKIRKRKAA